MLGPNYLNLEAYREAPEPKLVDFTINFGSKYLALKFNNKQVEQLNLYSIKRVVTEKSLEVMDAFPRDGEDLYKWYAVLSSELSKNYQNLWKNPLRKKKDASYHYNWAQKVPFQHIKSEVIIKIHKIMNSF